MDYWGTSSQKRHLPLPPQPPWLSACGPRSCSTKHVLSPGDPLNVRGDTLQKLQIHKCSWPIENNQLIQSPRILYIILTVWGFPFMINVLLWEGAHIFSIRMYDFNSSLDMDLNAAGMSCQHAKMLCVVLKYWGVSRTLKMYNRYPA
jgi:hypothetical protein